MNQAYYNTFYSNVEFAEASFGRKSEKYKEGWYDAKSVFDRFDSYLVTADRKEYNDGYDDYNTAFTNDLNLIVNTGTTHRGVMQIDWNKLESSLRVIRALYVHHGTAHCVRIIDLWISECRRHDMSGSIYWNIRMINLNREYNRLKVNT